jgi:RNA polymerase sigma-70 factor (sigma-E family)
MGMRATSDSHSAHRAAVAELFSLHGDELLRLALLLSGSRQLAEDLVQEAFARLWQHWDNVRDPDAAIGYLRVTVVNLARSSFRRRLLELRHRVALPAVVEPPDAAGRLDVLAALARLPMGKRACLVLRFYADLSEEQTARLLGISPGTVKSQTHRALAQLARLLDGAGARAGTAASHKGRSVSR